MEGALEREGRERRFQAAMTANLINTSGWVKRRVTADQLLGVPQERSSEQMSEAEKKRTLEKVFAEQLRRRGEQKAQAEEGLPKRQSRR